MKNILYATAIGLIAVLPSTAKAEDGSSNLYLSVKVGLTSANDSDWEDGADSGDIGFDNGINFAGALGLKLGNHVRTELEVSYMHSSLDNISVDGIGSASLGGDLTSWGGLVNGYYDFMPESTFNPYITAGLGFMRHKGSIDSVAGLSFDEVSSSDTVFAYQLGLGATVKVSPKVAFDGGYRYLATSDADLDGTDIEYDAHEFRIGARYNF